MAGYILIETRPAKRSDAEKRPTAERPPEDTSGGPRARVLIVLYLCGWGKRTGLTH